MIGTTVSHYTVLEKLGEGGMGVVYKGQDTKLDRTVALKFLPTQLTPSEQDKSRFVQEARAAAALSHPNICTIHDIQDCDGQMFIVMEFVDGQTLREWKGMMSQKQAIEIGIQVADGLAAAHEKGIVHRDIKPENIMIRRDGICQIMDFGLAKLRQAKGTSRLTKEGSTLGTVGYMSPEQVQGRDADHRSDIFSLGVVLYEMLSGQSPFNGVHETAIMYEIVNVDPNPISSLKPEVDPELDAIVLECLAKEPFERYQSAAEIAKDLRRFKRESSKARVSRITASRPVPRPSSLVQDITQLPEQAPVTPAPAVSKKSSTLIPWLVAAAMVLVAAGAIAVLFTTQPSSDVEVIRASILPPSGINYNTQVGGHIAISPDGRTLAFVGTDSVSKSQLWVRHLNSLAPIALSGTDGAEYPFWSYDNRYIGFFASGKLKRIEASGGPPLTVCDAPQGRGGTWNQAGVIVFAPSTTAGLSRVSAAGGAPVTVTKTDSTQREQNHRWPHFLPDGQHFFYVNQTTGSGGGSENDAVFLASLDTTVQPRLVVHAASNMIYARGFLFYLRQEVLMAQPFDERKLEFTGDAFPVVEQIIYSAPRSRGIFSLSAAGTLVYQSGGMASASKLAWFDFAGKDLGSFGDRSPNLLASLSADRKKIVLDSYDVSSRNYDIWIYDLMRNASTRLTFEQSAENVPIWSPDGTSILFSSDRKGHNDLYLKSASGSGNEELVFESSLDKYATSWSIDGKFVALSVTGNLKTQWDLWILSMDGRTAVPVLQTEFNEWLSSFSPDSRWVAYQSDESGRYEIYVRSFRVVDGKPTIDAGGKWQVSTGGGIGAQWSRDGKKLFFVSRDRKLLVVNVGASASSFESSTPVVLFDLDARGQSDVMDVRNDESRILMRVRPIESFAPVSLVRNWQKEVVNK
jgi:serine/threonine protein kinase